VTEIIRTSRDRSVAGSVRPESAVEEVRDRLAGLLPEEALAEALEGLGPEEITGPGEAGWLPRRPGLLVSSLY
jgi:hypothetical protein